MGFISFFGLWEKEWYVIRFYVFILLTMDVVWMIAIGGFNWDTFFWGFSMLKIFHLFLPAVLFLYSLNKESSQFELFLHSPRSAFLLTGVKGLHSIIPVILSLSFINALFLFTGKTEDMFSFSKTIQLLWIADAFIFRSALLLAALSFFLWVIHLLLKPYTGSFSVLLSIALFFSFNSVASKMKETSLYETLTSWGRMRIEIRSKTGEIFPNFTEGWLTVYAGEFILALFLSATLFIVGVAIFERRVEGL